jgi:HKD family nuclease
MLIIPPFESLSTHLAAHLTRDPPYARFYFSVAWARMSGVAQIDHELAQFGGEKVGVVGVDFADTSFEALAVLLQMLDELWIMHTTNQQTFHPKAYVFWNDSEQQEMLRIIGSSNLTYGGLDNNYELCVAQELDATTSEGQSEIERTIAYFDRLRGMPGCERITSLEHLEELQLEGLIHSEQASTSRSEQSLARPRTHATRGKTISPVRPQRQRRAPSVLPDLPDLPTPDIAEADDADFDDIFHDFEDEEEDMRSEQAAAYLSLRLGWEISPAMVLNWASRGYFPNSYKLRETRPSPRFFPRADLDAFIPPVFSHWGPGKPKYASDEEREAAERESRRRQNERKRLPPPDGYIGQEAALDILGFSRQRLHALVVRGDIKTHPPYEERTEGQRHWRVWYLEDDVRKYAEQRRGGSDDEQT